MRVSGKCGRLQQAEGRTDERLRDETRDRAGEPDERRELLRESKSLVEGAERVSLGKYRRQERDAMRTSSSWLPKL
jgi:hypothetical protein